MVLPERMLLSATKPVAIWVLVGGNPHLSVTLWQSSVRPQ